MPQLSKRWILAVVACTKACCDTFLSPYLLACPLRVNKKVFVPLFEVRVYRGLGRSLRLVVAAMDDAARHAAKNGFDDIQKLCRGWQGCELDAWLVSLRGRLVVARDELIEFLRQVPRRRIPRDVEL